MEIEWPVHKWEWTCSAAPSNTYKSFAPEVFPRNPLPLGTTTCRILHCPRGRAARYVTFCPDVFLFLEISFACWQLFATSRHALWSHDTTGESLVKEPQKCCWPDCKVSHQQNQDFFPLFSLPAGFLLHHSLCGRGIQTLLHYSLTWTGKASPYVFPNVCVHITSWTLESVALIFW